MWLRSTGPIVTVAISLPSALLAAGLKYAMKHPAEAENIWFIAPLLSNLLEFDLKPAAYSSLVAFTGFLVIFRTSHAYSRFQQGGHMVREMQAQIHNAASGIMTFTKSSKLPAHEVEEAKQMTLRLFSLLGALCMSKLEGPTVSEARLASLEVIDIESFDATTLDALTAEYENKNAIELVHHWIEGHIEHGVSVGLMQMSPPMVARLFAQLAQAMVKFQDCRSLATIPFPFPYSACSLLLLVVHWVMTPIVICHWTSHISVAAVFSFVLVFMLWELRSVAEELENPFAGYACDLPVAEYQRNLNSKLRTISGTSASTLPKFKVGCDVVKLGHYDNTLLDFVSPDTSCVGSDDLGDDDREMSNPLPYVRMSKCNDDDALL